MYCKECGSEIDDRAVVCHNCGIQVGEFVFNNMNKKSPWFAVFLSFIWVGLGQLYNGNTKTGIVFILIDIFMFGLILIGVWGFPLIFMIYGMWDAYQGTMEYNDKL